MDEIEQLLILQDRDQKIMRMEEELSRVEPEKSALMAKSEEANQHLQETRKQAQQIESQRCLLYTSPSPRDRTRSRMPSSA